MYEDDVRFFKEYPRLVRPLVERAIVRRIVLDALDLGALISVHDGEEWALRKSNDMEQIMDEIMSTDMDTLVFHSAGMVVGNVTLIYGNDGYDVIADHSSNPDMEELLEGAEKMADKIGDFITEADPNFNQMLAFLENYK